MRRPAAVLATAVIAVLATAGTASAATRTQSFVITQTNDNPRRITGLGIGEGSINATGRDVVLSETDTGGRDRFVFPAGNLIVVHTKISERATCDPSTGTFTAIERGTYKITRGTDAYEGYTGSGKYKVVFTARDTGSGCQGEPSSTRLVVDADGTINTQ